MDIKLLKSPEIVIKEIRPDFQDLYKDLEMSWNYMIKLADILSYMNFVNDYSQDELIKTKDVAEF